VATTRELGAAGEEAAARHLRRRGMRILHRNLRLGRAGELDIVAQSRGTLVFVEVKSKLSGDPLGGLTNITAAKQRKLAQLGALYLQQYGGSHSAVRFDAVEVEYPDETLKRPRITHLTDAFRAG